MTAPRFYEVARLTRQSYTLEPGLIRIDLDAEALVVITNDNGFAAAYGDDAIFWVSGGGTIVIGGRYVPLVRRPPGRLHPAPRYSLFTGRADGQAEWLAPHLLVREMFEEMIVSDGSGPLRPVAEDCQNIADEAWRGLRDAGLIGDEDGGTLPLTPIALPTTRVEIHTDGRTTRDALCCHISSRNEVNVLFAFAAELDPNAVLIRDGEFHRESGVIHRHGREVVLYDMTTGTARPVSAPGSERPIARAEMSEHLTMLLDALTLTH